MSYNLNFYNVLCQLYADNAGGGALRQDALRQRLPLVWHSRRNCMRALNLSCGSTTQAHTEGQSTQQLAPKNNVLKNRKRLPENWSGWTISEMKPKVWCGTREGRRGGEASRGQSGDSRLRAEQGCTNVRRSYVSHWSAMTEETVPVCTEVLQYRRAQDLQLALKRFRKKIPCSVNTEDAGANVNGWWSCVKNI